MKKEELDILRNWLIDNIFQNGSAIWDDNIREVHSRYTECLDLMDVIAGLYNILHKEVTGSPYDYMWHWMNKEGSWCDDNYLMEVIKNEMGSSQAGQAAEHKTQS